MPWTQTEDYEAEFAKQVGGPLEMREKPDWTARLLAVVMMVAFAGLVTFWIYPK